MFSYQGQLLHLVVAATVATLTFASLPELYALLVSGANYHSYFGAGDIYIPDSGADNRRPTNRVPVRLFLHCGGANLLHPLRTLQVQPSSYE